MTDPKPGDLVSVLHGVRYVEDYWGKVGTVQDEFGLTVLPFVVKFEDGNKVFFRADELIVLSPKPGMTSQELADEVASTIEACRKRVLGVGREQYAAKDDSRQKFESMPLDDLLVMAAEELEDTIVYAVMERIRLQRLRAALSRGFEAYRSEYEGSAL